MSTALLQSQNVSFVHSQSLCDITQVKFR